MFIKCKCNNEEGNMIQGQCFHTDESNVDICEKDYVNNGALAVKQHLQMERISVEWRAGQILKFTLNGIVNKVKGK